MANWLPYLGGGLLTISGALIGYFAWAYNYFKSELKDDPAYRAKAAAWLTSHALLAAYRDKLEAALNWLQRWMGNPRSLRALGVCINVSMVYSVVFFIGSWAAGGPGTVGRVVLLPALVWWQRTLWGSLPLVWLSAVLLLVLFNERIDRALEARLRRRLERRVGERAELAVRRWYRVAGGTAAASALLAAALAYAGFSGASNVFGP